MKQQKGFTLIELMISIAIGLLVTTAAVSMFVSLLYTNKTHLKNIRLNQELRSAMTAMTRDLRRAGHYREAATHIGGINPYAQLSITNSNQTINFAYDAATGSTVETYGYRLDSTSGTVQGCNSTATSCTNWESITDSDLTEITGLTFTPTNTVVGGVTLTKIAISMTGRLRKDNTFSRTLQETVQIRN